MMMVKLHPCLKMRKKNEDSLHKKPQKHLLSTYLPILNPLNWQFFWTRDFYWIENPQTIEGYTYCCELLREGIFLKKVCEWEIFKNKSKISEVTNCEDLLVLFEEINNSLLFFKVKSWTRVAE